MIGLECLLNSMAGSGKPLTPAEKEDRETERLIGRRPPPSRKHVERRGPKFDNRRRRIKEDDPDQKPLAKDSPDTQVRSSFDLLGCAERVSLRMSAQSPWLHTNAAVPYKKAINKAAADLHTVIDRVSPSLGKAFLDQAKTDIASAGRESNSRNSPIPIANLTNAYRREIDSFKKDVKTDASKLVSILDTSPADETADVVSDVWPAKSDDWSGKAAVITALNSVIAKTNVPRSIVEAVVQEPGKVSSPHLLKSVVKNASSMPDRISEDSASKLSQLLAIRGVIDSNPVSIDAAGIRKDSSPVAESVFTQVNSLADLGGLMRAWDSSMKSFKPVKRKFSEHKVNMGDFDAALDNVEKFFSSPSLPVDPKGFMVEMARDAVSKIGDVPPRLKATLEGMNVEFEAIDADTKKLVSDLSKTLKESLQPALKKARDAVSRAYSVLKGGGGPLHGLIEDADESIDDMDRIIDSVGSGIEELKLVSDEHPEVVDLFDKFERVLKAVDDVREKYENMDDDGGPDAGRTSAASNERLRSRMSVRSAAYHGVLDLNHPGEFQTEYESYDRRYFGEKHYESILSFASNLMKEDWLKYGWDDGHATAKLRAALDLAIWLADDNLYQAKIDAETYDMLLNRLAGWGHDQFSETVLPQPTGNKRSASMTRAAHIAAIVGVANSLKSENPALAVEILRNVRALVAALPAEKEEAEFKEKIEKLVRDAIKEEQRKLGDKGDFDLDEREVDEWLKGFDKIMKTGSCGTILSTHDLRALIDVAHSNPGVRQALTPIIAASVKKKTSKGKGKKAPPKKTSKKAPPKKTSKKAPSKKAPSKKAPPKGKKPTGKGKKGRKASITHHDLAW